MKFSADQWTGNPWPSIDIEPVDSAYFLPLLLHLATTYHFPMPPVIDGIDTFIADFALLDSQATMHLDPWTFSVAFSNHEARDQVLATLQQLPPDYL